MALMLAKLYTALREAGRAIPPAPRPCDAGGSTAGPVAHLAPVDRPREGAAEARRPDPQTG